MKFIPRSTPASGQGWGWSGGDGASALAVVWGGPRALSDGPWPFSQRSGAALTGRRQPGGQGRCGPRGPRFPTCPTHREAVSLRKVRAEEWAPLEGSGHRGPGRLGGSLRGLVPQNTEEGQNQLLLNIGAT